MKDVVKVTDFLPLTHYVVVKAKPPLLPHQLTTSFMDVPLHKLLSNERSQKQSEISEEKRKIP